MDRIISFNSLSSFKAKCSISFWKFSELSWYFFSKMESNISFFLILIRAASVTLISLLIPRLMWYFFTTDKLKLSNVVIYAESNNFNCSLKPSFFRVLLILSFISFAAAFVNVKINSLLMGILLLIFLNTLWVKTAVFPLPAPADTITLQPSTLIAWSCSSVHLLAIYITS